MGVSHCGVLALLLSSTGQTSASDKLYKQPSEQDVEEASTSVAGLLHSRHRHTYTDSLLSSSSLCMCIQGFISVTRAALELTSLLSQPPKCWVSGNTPPHQALFP